MMYYLKLIHSYNYNLRRMKKRESFLDQFCGFPLLLLVVILHSECYERNLSGLILSLALFLTIINNALTQATRRESSGDLTYGFDDARTKNVSQDLLRMYGEREKMVVMLESRIFNYPDKKNEPFNVNCKSFEYSTIQARNRTFEQTS
jgi:hypothetical protein